MTTQTTYLPAKTWKQRLSAWVLRLIGWRIQTLPALPPKYLIVVAHHTSNWDLPLGLLFLGVTGIKAHFIAKDDLFRGPLGWLLRWLGGIPVNRRSRTNFVDQIAREFEQRDRLAIAITPEGTRSKTDYWKSGFYHIALKANLPVVLGYLDYRRKMVGYGKIMHLTGDIEADLDVIREFFSHVTGKFPHQHGRIRFRPRG